MISNFLFNFLYKLFITELKVLKIYIKENLLKGFIKYLILFIKVLIIFIKKKNRGFRLNINY